MSGTWPPRAALAPSQQTPRRQRRSLWQLLDAVRSRLSMLSARDISARHQLAGTLDELMRNTGDAAADLERRVADLERRAADLERLAQGRFLREEEEAAPSLEERTVPLTHD